MASTAYGRGGAFAQAGLPKASLACVIGITGVASNLGHTAEAVRNGGLISLHHFVVRSFKQASLSRMEGRLSRSLLYRCTDHCPMKFIVIVIVIVIILVLVLVLLVLVAAVVAAAVVFAAGRCSCCCCVCRCT